MRSIDDHTRQLVLEHTLRDHARLLGVLVIPSLIAAVLVGSGTLTTICGVLLVVFGVGLLAIEWAVDS
jgi:hypothetical protein